MKIIKYEHCRRIITKGEAEKFHEKEEQIVHSEILSSVNVRKGSIK